MTVAARVLDTPPGTVRAQQDSDDCWRATAAGTGFWERP